MKKIFALIVAVASVAAVVTSCSEKQFADLYPNPSKTSVATCDKLFTGTLIAGNQNTFNSYWRMYTWDNYFGKLAQTIGFSNNSGSVYYINDGYANDRWNNFYDILRNFRKLEEQYQKDNDAENKVFLELAEIFMLDHATQLVDIWGDIPFTKACYLGVTFDVASSYAAYDKGEDVYKHALTRLDAIYQDLASMNVSATVQAKLNKQDYMNGGSIEKWMRYCNGLMLRLGVHVSAQGSLVAEGKAAVDKAAKRLLPTDIDNEIFVQSDNDGFQHESRDSWKDINNTANQKVIDAMQKTGVNDPRLQVIYVPTKNAYTPAADAPKGDVAYGAGEYYGRSTAETDDEQNARGGSNHNTEATRYYARLNGYTYTSNSFARCPILSSAEAWFLLAEAYQQGYASGTAKEAFKKGIECSIKFYYRENMESSQARLSIYSDQADDFRATAVPSDAQISAFAESVWNAYSNKMEGIMTEKWVHFNIKQATQAWTDIRRTGYPALKYPKDGADNNGYPTVTQRVKYPNSEATNNAANYKVAAAACGEDSAYSVLFYAKEVK